MIGFGFHSFIPLLPLFPAMLCPPPQKKGLIYHFRIDHTAPCLPPKFCITIVFDFSLDDCNTQEKSETMAIYAKFGVGGAWRREVNKVHCGQWDFHPLCSKFNIAWGGRGRRRGKVTSFTYILSPERSQHFSSPPDLHSGLTHLDMASFFRNPF